MLFTLVFKSKIHRRNKNIEMLRRKPCRTNMMLGIRENGFNKLKERHFGYPSFSYFGESTFFTQNVFCFSQYVINRIKKFITNYLSFPIISLQVNLIKCLVGYLVRSASELYYTCSNCIFYNLMKGRKLCEIRRSFASSPILVFINIYINEI